MVLSLVALGIDSYSIYWTISHPLTYVEFLNEALGYDSSVIDSPIPVELFTAVEQPSLQVIWGSASSFGWYTGQEEGILLNSTLAIAPGDSSPFYAGDSSFGFFLESFQYLGGEKWYTESAKNNGESHVKVYPTIVDGRVDPSSYVLCWEVWPFSVEPSFYVPRGYFIDFIDLVVRVDGVAVLPPGHNVRLLRVVVDDREAADSLFERLQAGETFAGVGGQDIGWFLFTDLRTELQQALHGLDVAQYTQPFLVEDELLILYLREVSDGTTPPPR